jgi:hypothetical protein
MTTALLNAADSQAKKPAAATPIPPRRAEVPAGAVEREPGRFFYTDKDGKKWIFVRTPFGYSRLEDKPGASSPAEPNIPLANVKVTESGDTVSFERPSSFGVTKWQKKKADLTDDEKAALRRSQEEASRPGKAVDAPSKQDR